MAGSRIVRATFEDFVAFEHALAKLKGVGAESYDAYGPVDLTELEDMIPGGLGLDVVRIAATIGALLGLFLFMFMAIKTSLNYNLIVGGKPPVSLIPYVVVGYEGTILLGALFAFAAVLFFARMYPSRPAYTYRQAYSGSEFGIHVRCESDKCSEYSRLLKDAEAVEVDELH